MTGTPLTNRENPSSSLLPTGPGPDRGRGRQAFSKRRNHFTKGGWEGFKSYFPRKWMTKPFFFSLAKKLKGWSNVLREILYGMTAHEMDLELRKERGHLDHLFMLVVFGDLVGLPLLPPYYSMRLLPYIVPSVEKWKRSLLREKDLTDFVAADIG
jgi:hypothetical protein